MAKNLLLPLVPVFLALGAAALAADAAPDSAELQRQLADVQDKLSTSLHSYGLLQDQLSQAKAEADKNAADKAALAAQLDEAKRVNAELRSAAMAAEQLDPLRTQLRQKQDALAALASENAELKMRLALAGSAPSGGGSSPTRPGAEGSAMATLAPVPVATPVPPPAASQTGPAGSPAQPAAPPAQPRIHVVVEGDSLTRISKKYYGDASRYDDILAAIRDVIHDENHLVVGMKLKIP
jgi:nucleoid-associated protein YgaU